MRMILLVAATLMMMMAATALAQDGSSPTLDQSVSNPDSTATDGTAAGVPPSPAGDITGAIGQAKDAVKAAKEGRWWYFSALVLTVLMFLLKFIGLKAGFWAKLGRWRYVIVPVLSLGAALLAAFQGGVSFDTALGVFTSAYAMASLEELWTHGILGRPHSPPA